MDKISDIVKGTIGAVIVGAVGISLLSLGAGGALPNGFGLFNMDSVGTRITLLIVLLILAGALARVYLNGQENSKE